jgi:hypothetical protein
MRGLGWREHKTVDFTEPEGIFASVSITSQNH